MILFDKRLKSENGFSLVELLAALTLFSLIAGIIYSTINFGFDSYYKVNIEGSLRDEGDLVTTAIINKMYTFAPSSVDSLAFNRNGIILNNRLATGKNYAFKFAKDSDNKGKLYMGEIDKVATDISLSNPYELKSSIVLNDEGSEVACEKNSTTDCMEGSKITLECNNSSSCVSGIIKIRLVLSQEFKNKSHKLTLESKFGF